MDLQWLHRCWWRMWETKFVWDNFEMKFLGSWLIWALSKNIIDNSDSFQETIRPCFDLEINKKQTREINHLEDNQQLSSPRIQFWLKMIIDWKIMSLTLPDEHSSSTLMKWLEKCVKHDFETQRWVEVRAIVDLKHCSGSSKIKTRIPQNKRLRNKMLLNCFKGSQKSLH